MPLIKSTFDLSPEKRPWEYYPTWEFDCDGWRVHRNDLNREWTDEDEKNYLLNQVDNSQ